MSLSRSEKEHIIRISDDPEESLNFYTHNENWAKKLLKRGATLIRTGKVEGREISWTLSCPRDWFKLPSPKKRVSTAQREASGARLRAIHQARRAFPEDVQ